MSGEEEIRAALRRLGHDDILGWARERATKPLAEINQELGAGTAPFQLDRFMSKAARESGRYDEFVRTEAVRRLNEHFPKGFGQSQKQDFGLASGWAMWAGFFEAAHKDKARQVWGALSETLRQHTDWVPQNPEDTLVLKAFEGHCFLPTDGARRLEDVVSRVYSEAQRENESYFDKKAVHNLRGLPPGYGFIYGVSAVDGEVCNGGFLQFYENTGGIPAPLAIDGFRVIGREDVAAIVEESVLAAKTWHPHLVEGLSGYPESPTLRSPRSFDELDDAYYGVKKERDWLEVALVHLVTNRPDLF